MDIQTFKKTKIDLSPLGFNLNGDFELYYSTPENAKILATSGVDGIHYCTIPGFGEMIFAVSPMNFGDCVHPIARNFEDLLRLLLHCVDMAALEQCFAWDEEQYKAFLIDCPATKEQQVVLDEIKNKCGLESIEDSFAYVKELQAEFDLSEIPYTEDYYDPEMNPAAPEQETEWAVCYGAGFWSKNANGNPGEEIAINKQFAWGNEIWHIPSIYSCDEGLVIDYCVEIEPDSVKAFMDKWYSAFENEDKISREVREQIEQENPMEVSFRSHLQVNGEEIIAKQGCSTPWIPENCLPEGVRSESEAKQIIKHYGLDEAKAWSFHRWSCPWKNVKKPSIIEAFKLKLKRHPTSIQGVRFKNPNVNDVITFTHPLTKVEHKLTVLEYEQQEFSSKGFANEEYEYPTHHTAMLYTLEPDLSPMNFSVRDCLDNDQPKRRPKNNFEPQATYDACSIGIIGGADGPTSITLLNSHKSDKHTAMSSLRFEPTDDVEWKIIFREKLIDDIEVELL